MPPGFSQLAGLGVTNEQLRRDFDQSRETNRSRQMSLARFLQDRKASVAPLLALTAIPLFGFVGVAVDYSNASSVRTSMQSALDSAALMLSKSAGTLNSTQLQTSANNLFFANFTRPEALNPQITATYSTQSNGAAVTISATAKIQTKILGSLGFSQLNIASTASVNWSNTRLRVALVLDNTGSMAQSGKMPALQTAAKNLLTQLKNAAQVDGDVYVSIVPFGKDVNVGPANYTSSWIDWTDWDIANGTCSKSQYTTKSTCNNHSGTWTPKAHSTWNGCVTDRDQNYDTLNSTPINGGTLFPAEQYASCNTSIMALSYDWTALNNKIDMMTPAGNTNQAIGLAWGWQSLSQTAPLNAPPLDPNYQYQQVIILLSDGLNTQDRWYSSANPIDTRQQVACNNAKAAGITIYSVLVMSGDSTVLKSCATDASKYFALTNANQIITTFDAIGTSLSRLHITH
jgi:Flp pilus assembly protein TadG